MVGATGLTSPVEATGSQRPGRRFIGHGTHGSTRKQGAPVGLERAGPHSCAKQERRHTFLAPSLCVPASLREAPTDSPVRNGPAPPSVDRRPVGAVGAAEDLLVVGADHVLPLEHPEDALWVLA